MNSEICSIQISRGANLKKRLVSSLIEFILLLIAAISTIIVLFIIYFIARDAIPFFKLRGFEEFFTGIRWYPSNEPSIFGAASIIFGTLIVTLVSSLISIPLAIMASISLSDILPFSVRQYVKPIIEMLAVIPSVAFGFFALVIFAPLLQRSGGQLLGGAIFFIMFPILILISYVSGNLLFNKFFKNRKIIIKYVLTGILSVIGTLILLYVYLKLSVIKVSSGTNILNVSVILAIMALPTMVSVSEDALSTAGRELRESSYALGATRAETIFKVILPAAKSGILAGISLGIMRVVGETMVVWMASGNAAHIPSPWYNIFEPVRTLTATIAGDMGEADQITGSARFHVLFAMALLLLLISFISNSLSEWFLSRSKKKLRN